MEASEMLDVLHYFLEEDLNTKDNAEISAKSATRVRIYGEFYGREYKYAYRGEDSEENSQPYNYFDGDDEDGTIEQDMNSIKPFSPREQKAKPYTPPTDFDGTAAQPFGSILDAPMR